jgi:hypothetical protein
MLLRSGEVELRSFDESLTDAVYEIRNHPSVREHLRNTEPIPRESHLAWVRDHLLARRQVHLFVVHAGGGPVGIALLRNVTERTAEIGVMVVEAEQRPLVCYKASHLVGYYGFEMLGLEELYSYVPRHNSHALAFNLHSGLVRTGKDSEIYHELVLSKEHSRTHPTHKHFRDKYPIEVTRDP